MRYREPHWRREPWMPMAPTRLRKRISILPTLMTLGNLLCGFAALGYASGAGSVEAPSLGGPYAAAGYLIFAAMVLDILDGGLARLARATSDFGTELDSLADVVTFGVVPAFLCLKIVSHVLADGGAPAIAISPVAESMLGRFYWIIAAIYVACAALRLARFNTLNQHGLEAHLAFKGLPTPGAAGVVAASVIFFEALRPGSPHVFPFNVPPVLGAAVTKIFPYAMPVILLLLAILMVSRISYGHLINQYLRGRKPFSYVVRAVLLLLLVLWQPQLTVLIVIYIYAFYPPVRAAWRKLLRRPEPPSLAAGIVGRRAEDDYPSV